MNTVGWFLVLVAGLIVRGITKGRSLTQIPGDLGDEFMAIIESDPAKLKEALARTGDSAAAGAVADPNAAPNTSSLGVPATPTPATGNPYDANSQRTRQAYNAAHPNSGGTPTVGGNKPLA